ncbi:MAG: hypothetical protein LBE74_00375 [Treponema sp.]|jgi:hypothetical protein|nr:hypothetical protein [Treponema sp.]
MTGFNDEVLAFITGDFLERDIKLGDSFHLISFADKERAPRLETSMRVMGNEDVERIKQAMRGLFRVDADADIDGALAFAKEYASGLGARQKKIIIVTPAPMPKTSLVLEVAQKGTSRPPLPPRPQEKPPVPPQETQKQEPRSSDSPTIEEETSDDAPDETQDPKQDPEEKQPNFAPPKIITPDDSTPPRTIKTRPVYKNRRVDSLTTLGAVLVLALAIALLLCSAAVALKCRRIRLSANRVFASLPDNKMDGPCLLSLSVENQNTNIGRRNFHSVKTGFSLTVGGGDSDFLIFLTSLPSRLAKIHFNGEHCSFIPLKRQFFPEITSKTLPDCIGRTIRIKTEKNYDIFIRVVLHESPLQKLNRLLNLVRPPGR